MKSNLIPKADIINLVTDNFKGKIKRKLIASKWKNWLFWFCQKDGFVCRGKSKCANCAAGKK